MQYTRRDIGRLALTALPAATLFTRPLEALAQARRPSSVIGGVHIGTITDAVKEVARCLDFCKAALSQS